MPDIESRVAVLEDHRKAVNGRLDSIVEGIHEVREQLVAMRVEIATERGKLHWIWVLGAVVMTALAQYVLKVFVK